MTVLSVHVPYHQSLHVVTQFSGLVVHVYEPVVLQEHTLVWHLLVV